MNESENNWDSLEATAIWNQRFQYTVKIVAANGEQMERKIEVEKGFLFDKDLGCEGAPISEIRKHVELKSIHKGW